LKSPRVCCAVNDTLLQRTMLVRSATATGQFRYRLPLDRALPGHGEAHQVAPQITTAYRSAWSMAVRQWIAEQLSRTRQMAGFVTKTTGHIAAP
jgi:hypothetical protein